MNTDLPLTQIDELGILLAQISDLTAKADAIKEQLRDTATSGGPTTFEGALFSAMVVGENRKKTDYKKLLKDLGATPEQIARYTTINAVFTVRMTER